MIKEKQCPCGKQFKQYNSLQKYCSFKCQNEYKKTKPKAPKLETLDRHTTITPKIPLDKILDALWRKIIRLLAHGRCEYCNQLGNEAHHIKSRKFRSLRWDIDNGIFLCTEHHTGSSDFSAHLTPKEFKNWIEQYRGQGYYQKLLDKINLKVILSEKLRELKEFIKNLRS